MKTNVEELNQMYDDVCHFYLTRDWKDCPRCKCKPVLGWHVKPMATIHKDESKFKGLLTLTCKCDTYEFATATDPQHLVAQWTNHCYIIRATEKGMIEVRDKE